jgi:hypothetical protein
VPPPQLKQRGEMTVSRDPLYWQDRGLSALPPLETLPLLKPLPSERSERRSPVFLIIGVCALGLSLATPRILLFFPIMVTLASSVVALFRQERGRGAALIVICFAVGLVVLNGYDLGAPSTSNLGAAEIADWNWAKDPTFGGRGTIKWNVSVRNKSSQYIRNVKVELTTYDKNGKLVSSTFAFVEAIPPDQSRSTNSFADLYGTESTAKVQLGEVYFAK